MARFNRTSYKTADVFAAACAAHRANCGYLKIGATDDEGNVIRLPNKILIRQFLDSSFDIRDEDRDLSEKVMQFCQALTFKMLTDRKLSDFEQSMLRVVETETLESNLDIAIVSSLPAAYIRENDRKVVDTRIKAATGFIGAVGDKIQFTAEILRCNFSDQWGTFFVTAITPDNKVIFFAHRNKLEVTANINGEGKVKSHRNEREDSTQLNYVKIL
jgi:hypothetical protein